MIDTPKPTISQAEPDAVRSPVHSRRIASVRARVATGLAALVVSIPLAAQQLAFEPVADGLTAPIHLEQPADGRGRRFIMQQDGVVRVLDRDDGLLPDPFIDLRSRLLPLDKNFEERGLLGVAGDGTAVTGARLDRGEAIPDLVRKLVVSDWSAAFDRPSGQLFVGPAARWGDRWPYAQALQAGSRIVSLAEDVAGEIYVLTNETFGPYGTTGKMSRLVARP